MKFVLTGLQVVYQLILSQKTRLLFLKKSKGFTLLETLTALAILAVALAALLDNYSNSLSASDRINKNTQARILAQSLMSENFILDKAKIGKKSGRYDSYRWSVSKTPISNKRSDQQSQGKWQLYEIKVEVMWAKRAKYQLTKLKLGELYE